MTTPPHPLLAQLHCQLTLRPYQRRAIEVAEQALATNSAAGRRWHLVAPPGSGKTILGLELIRRLGAPAVIFSPNAAIQRQWADKVRFFLPTAGSLSASQIVAEHLREPLPPILSLTYQSMTVATRETEVLDDLARALWAEEVGDVERLEALRQGNPDSYREELLRYRARVRRRLLEEPEFDAVTLLHPSARALMEALVVRGTSTVVLDECHHLTGSWAILLGALLRRLPNAIVIGLTATPPVDRSNRELVRYLDLVGEIDFQVPTPAVVRDGDLAPFQDLVYLTTPTPEEMRFIASQHLHWTQLQTRLNEAGRLDRWIESRIKEPRSEAGTALTWEEFTTRRHTLAVAGVRWFLAHGWEVPEQVQLTREMIDPLTMEDRLRLIADFALRSLKLSQEPENQALYRELKAAGRSLGYSLTESGFRRTTAPVDRLLSLSSSKQHAALTILRQEWQAIGERLRAVIITDFERSSATVLRDLSGVLDPDAESALGMMRLLAQSDLEEELRPVLVTGKTLLCDDKVAEVFMAAARAWFTEHELDVTLQDELVEGASFHRILGSGQGWRTGSYVAMVTSLLERGVTRCLVGTRALLGEGWDALALNTFIDLTYATTFASVNQLRGRAIRLDPAWEEKAANNWDVVCIAPGFEKGMQDYDRFVRKHDTFFGVSDDGIIEVGVGHVHPLLHEVGGAELGAERERINAEMLARAGRRDKVHGLWQVGTPYENIEIGALDLRYPERPLTVSSIGSARRSQAGLDVRGLAALGAAGVVAIAMTPVVVGLLSGLAQALAEALFSGGFQIGAIRVGIALTWLLLSVGLVGRSLLLFLRGVGQRFLSASAETTIRAMALALLEALQRTEQLPASLTPEAIHLSTREDGFVRVWLEDQDPTNVERFSRAMAELLGPITDEFRYMIPRYELVLPDHPVGKLWRWLQWATNRWAGEVAAWHPVPQELGNRAERVRAFEDAWQLHVSPGEALFLQRASAVERLRAARQSGTQIERRTKRIWR
ncbi:MAG: DEAD/DEAH box helicase family protein [Ardenticatenales bacterium]|nr:DEAD/DEAH box helicase family protein [Ardenticatenales bacterium]